MVNYIVALYLGKRRNEIVQQCMDKDPFYLLKSHMLAIHKYKMEGIHKVTFVLNQSENTEAESLVEEILQEYKDLCSNKDIEIELLKNPDNSHISYGAWHYGVLNGLSDERTKHFFLLEDDYVPCRDNFHEPYLQKSAPDICYVCQLWSAPTKNSNKPREAQFGRVAITNGLLNADLSREIFKKYGRCFMLDMTKDYSHLSKSKTIDDVSKKYLLSGPAQKHFVRLYQDCNYRIVDLGKDWQQPFLTSRDVKIYGSGNPATIYPIHTYEHIDQESFFPIDIGAFKEDEIEFRKTTIEDVEVLNNIRNQSSQYLHDGRIFTTEQTAEWFQTNKPDWYSIISEGQMIGYFRISNNSSANHNIYIGSDLEESFRGRGIGYNAYIKMMAKLFNERKLNKISLEALETNQVALNLYKKIGFVEEGKRRQDVWRNDSWVDSIVMSMTRKEFMIKHPGLINSPCIGICSRKDETCPACERTLEQISSWKQYDQDQQINQIKMILNI